MLHEAAFFTLLSLQEGPFPDYFLSVNLLKAFFQFQPNYHFFSLSVTIKVITPSLPPDIYKYFYYGIIRNIILFYLSHCNLESISYNSLGHILMQQI